MRIELHDGTRKRSFRVRKADELTVRQYIDATCPPLAVEDPMELMRETLRRFTDIPEDLIGRIPIGQLQAIDAFLADNVETINREGAEAKRLAKVWRGEGPKTFEHGGVTYTVPQNIETDTTFDQWLFIHANMQAVEFEAQAISIVCAALLLPVGEAWDSAKAGDRVAMWDAAPWVVPMRITAFFLTMSERLRGAVSAYTRSRLTSHLRSLEQTLGDLMNATASGEPSTPPQS